MKYIFKDDAGNAPNVTGVRYRNIMSRQIQQQSLKTCCQQTEATGYTAELGIQ